MQEVDDFNEYVKKYNKFIDSRKSALLICFDCRCLMMPLLFHVNLPTFLRPSLKQIENVRFRVALNVV